MTSLTDVISKALVAAVGLKSAKADNEANTKAHVIEPVLSSLGWDLANFSEVDREYKVFDGTFLDYALRVDGIPKLFIEAKSVGKSLADKQFIAQTVNYANNEGVVWCVLTNGLVYQIYKSNEPVSMERKLLLEVDLSAAEADGSLGQAATSLGVISKASVAAGKIDEWAQMIFTDLRVRRAVSSLASNPPSTLVQLVGGAIEGPALPERNVAASLHRILQQVGGSPGVGGLIGAAPNPDISKAAGQSSSPVPGTKTPYTVEHHTWKKPAAIVDLFQRVDSFALGLGADVQRRPTKVYVGYFAGKRSFFTIELQKAQVWVYLSIPPAEAMPWDKGVMRDVREIGHFGMGDTEFRLTADDQLTELQALISASYMRNRR